MTTLAQILYKYSSSVIIWSLDDFDLGLHWTWQYVDLHMYWNLYEATIELCGLKRQAAL